MIRMSLTRRTLMRIASALPFAYFAARSSNGEALAESGPAAAGVYSGTLEEAVVELTTKFEAGCNGAAIKQSDLTPRIADHKLILQSNWSQWESSDKVRRDTRSCIGLAGLFCYAQVLQPDGTTSEITEREIFVAHDLVKRFEQARLAERKPDSEFIGVAC